MFEFTNILDSSYGAYVVNGAYRGAGNSLTSASEAPSRDQAIAIIRELLRGNSASIRQSARNASTAVSIIQTFSEAIDTIAAKLSTMQELAQKALSPDYSRVQIEEMQTQFQSLAKEINQKVKCTEYNYNKLFTSKGKTVSIPIGNGSKIDIFAKDFTFNAQGLNIATNPQKAISKLKETIGNVDEYKQYLSHQAIRLDDATATIEFEIYSAMGVDLTDFNLDLVLKISNYTASLIKKDKSTSLNTQANITGDESLQLLKTSD